MHVQMKSSKQTPLYGEAMEAWHTRYLFIVYQVVPS